MMLVLPVTGLGTTRASTTYFQLVNLSLALLLLCSDQLLHFTVPLQIPQLLQLLR